MKKLVMFMIVIASLLLSGKAMAGSESLSVRFTKSRGESLYVYKVKLYVGSGSGTYQVELHTVSSTDVNHQKTTLSAPKPWTYEVQLPMDHKPTYYMVLVYKDGKLVASKYSSRKMRDKREEIRKATTISL